MPSDRSIAQRPNSERGSVLIVMLISMVAIGALTMAHLTKVVAENNRLRARVHSERAQQAALAELEFAKNVVNGAIYRGGNNTAISAAMGSTPPLIPGTEVEVRAIPGSSDWLMLTARGRYRDIERTAQVFVRERAPLSIYNFFVVDHPLGISGQPRGPIHSNKTVDFYFPGGKYDSQVTAVDGFNYRAGATADNTQLNGPSNPHAAVQNPLQGVDLTKIADEADGLRVTDDLIAEIRFNGDSADVSLFRPAHDIEVERTGTRNVIDRYEESFQAHRVTTATRTRTVDVTERYTERYQADVPVYAWRTVTKTVTKRRWIEEPPPPPGEAGGGSSVGGGNFKYGRWESYTERVTERERYVASYTKEWKTRTRRRKIGERQESYTETTREFLGNFASRSDAPSGADIEITRKTKPIYTTEEYTYTDTVRIPEEFVETRTVPASGTFYVAREVRAISGTLSGKVSLVTGGSARITGSIQYVDADGDTRMQNGTDASKPYVDNPDYDGTAVLALIAGKDIRYAQSGPDQLEVNASLISIDGTVSFEGITTNSDGTRVSAHNTDGAWVKESLRRLGGVVSRKRPVASYVDESNETRAGYRRGSSIMDRNLIIDGSGGISPPFMFEQSRPIWALSSPGSRVQPH